MSTLTYEAVIGLEVHAQLATETKIFAPAAVAFGAPPNSLVSDGCAALPGSLPVLNRRAVTLAIRAGLALDCDIQRRSIFDRKSYFYPDLPTGYQISQNDFPICLGGALRFDLEGEARSVPLTRIHLEQDAGKSSHEGDDRFSRIDLNRAGTALIEIVTDPEITSPEEAAAFFRELRAVLVALGVNDGNMAEGSLRCDANVSIRPVGTTTLGTRAEIKNLNSFRFLRDALHYEIARQKEVLRSGGTLVQETRLWSEPEKRTFSMREKVDGADYRYFPDPDIPPLIVDEAWVEEVRRTLPEIPSQSRARLQGTHGLSAYDAGLLVDAPGFVALFDAAVGAGASPKATVNMIAGAVAASINEGALRWDAEGARFVSEAGHTLEGEALAKLVTLQEDRTLTAVLARSVFQDMLATGRSPAVIVEAEGLRQETGTEALDAWIDQAFASAAREVEAYRAGRKKVLGAILGHVVRASGGKADPRAIRERLIARLEEEPS